MNFQVGEKMELHSYFILDIIDLRAVTQLVRKLYSGKKVQGNNFRFNMESKNVHLKKKKKMNVIFIFQVDQNIIGITISKDITEKILASLTAMVRNGQNKEDLH